MLVSSSQYFDAFVTLVSATKPYPGEKGASWPSASRYVAIIPRSHPRVAVRTLYAAYDFPHAMFQLCSRSYLKTGRDCVLQRASR